MAFLRSLRLNCLLAPGVPAVLGAAVLLAALHQAGVRQRAALDAAALAQVRCGAGAADPVAFRRADGGWSYAAVVHFGADDAVLPQAASGRPEVLAPGEPTPDLVTGFVRPHAWRRAGRLCAATRLPDGPGGLRRVFYAERPAPTAALGDLAAGGVAVLLVAGTLLAVYLARHLYRPVESLGEEAEAALAGRPPRRRLTLSPETAGVAASISALTLRVREQVAADGPDGTP